MNTALEEESRLIGSIYDAAMNPALWPSVLDAITTRVQGRTAIIIATDALNPGYNLIIPHNLPEASLIEYRERKLDLIDMEVTGGGLMRYGVGSARTAHEAYGSFESWRDKIGDFYPFLKKWGASAQAGVALEYGNYRWSVLGVHRPEEAGHFDSEPLEFLTRISPHIQRALQIHRQLIAVKDENTHLYAMLDAMNTGVVLLDSAGDLLYTNPHAARLFREHNVLDLQQGGLRAASSTENERLQRLIRGAIGTSLRDPALASAEPQDNHGGVISLSNPGKTRQLMLSIVPLSSPAGSKDRRSDRLAAAVFVTDPQQGHQVSERLLRENYRLTPREAGICQIFINAPRPEAVAEHSGLSLESVRHYLKCIYEKTGQHSQAELIRLLMGLSLDFEHIG